VAGGISRYLFASAAHERLGFHFPYGTLAVNLTGCLLIGFLNSLADSKSWVGPNERLLLMTGFCGAYTTFSSFILETSNLIHRGDLRLAGWNVALSVAGGYLLFRAGSWAGSAL
jgi:CrcB protein